MIILVSLKVDNGGSCLLVCTGIKKDPLLPANVILEGVKALSWPFAGHFIHVNTWSVDKKLVNHWMVGPVMREAQLTMGMLDQAGDGEGVPHPPGTLPVGEMNNIPGEVEKLVQQLSQEPDPASGEEPLEEPPR